MYQKTHAYWGAMWRGFLTILWVYSLWPILYGPAATAQDCIHWPEVYAQTAIQKIPRGAPIVRVGLIYNDTELGGDDWLSQGIADLLIRYLSVAPNLGVLPERHVGFLAAEHPVKYRIGGIFQHTQGWLRIFIQLKDKKDNLIAQFPMETPYPGHKKFFVGLREISESILKRLGYAETFDPKALQVIQNETANVHAYENAIKARQALESYDANKTEVALIWFQEARREDNRYPLAYEGLMEIYGFLSLVHKNNGQPYHTDLEYIGSTLNEMKKRTRKTPESRFLKEHVSYLAGTRALAKSDWAKASSELKTATTLVPEDPLAFYYLAEAYDKMGQKELAGSARNQAEQMNPCLKGQ